MLLLFNIRRYLCSNYGFCLCIYLHLGSVPDVLKEFAAKKCVKLGKLLKERGGLELEKKVGDNSNLQQTSVDSSHVKVKITP